MLWLIVVNFRGLVKLSCHCWKIESCRPSHSSAAKLFPGITSTRNNSSQHILAGMSNGVSSCSKLMFHVFAVQQVPQHGNVHLSGSFGHTRIKKHPKAMVRNTLHVHFTHTLLTTTALHACAEVAPSNRRGQSTAIISLDLTRNIVRSRPYARP